MMLDAIYRWLRRAGVDVRSVPAGVAEVRLTNDRYIIGLGPEFESLTDEQKAQALLHEVGHILRADLLAQQVHEDPRSWNWATDAVINETLQSLRDLGVTYEKLRQEYPDLPELLQPASVIYSIIRNANQSASSCGLSGSGSGSEGSGNQNADNQGGQPSRGLNGVSVEDSLVADYDDPEAAAEAHKRTLIDILIGASELPEEFRSQVFGVGRYRAVGYKPPKPVAMEGLVRKLEQMIRSGHGGSSRAYRRTYRRVRYGLPMYLRVPVAEVLLAIDVSGSMTKYYPNLRYIAQALSRRHNVRIVVWDVEWKQTSPYGEWPEAGGTDVKAAYQAIQALRPDIAVIVTDGYFNWLDPDVPCPILWAVLESSKDEIRKLRPGDALVVIPED